MIMYSDIYIYTVYIYNVYLSFTESHSEHLDANP